jgi:predicted DNA binding CopG/RHH family protein
VGLSSQSVTLVERGRFVFLDVPSGVTLGDCTMREPKLGNLKVDVAETAKIRRSLKKQKSVKITINLDADSLNTLKKEASASGVPYQRLLNRLLRESLTSKRATESRIDRLERELREVKRKLAA